MYRCAQEHADVIIDGQQYRLQSRKQLSILEDRLWGRKGVTFVDLGKTRMRLQAEEEMANSGLSIDTTQ